MSKFIESVDTPCPFCGRIMQIIQGRAKFYFFICNGCECVSKPHVNLDDCRSDANKRYKQ